MTSVAMIYMKKKNVVYDFKNVTGITKAEFMRRLENSEVISVDLFDTLIMRRTLFATDVIELTDEKLKEQGIVIEKFCDRRLESEKYLSQQTASTLVKIYEYMLEKYDIQNVTAQQLAELEWKLDYELVVPRREICEAAAQAYEGGKAVYIVSDTYYTKQQLVQLLDKCKITKYTQVLASCEYRTGKTQQLFEVLKKRLDGKSCIHIGDDDIADIQSAGSTAFQPVKYTADRNCWKRQGIWGCRSLQRRCRTESESEYLFLYCLIHRFSLKHRKRKLRFGMPMSWECFCLHR